MIYRSTAADFVVEELPRFEPKGEGAHQLLWIEKCERDTAQIAADLARAAGCAREEVGFAGRKDRFAVTRQWFSVPGERLPASLELEGSEILDRSRHDRRLRAGDLRGNRFRLRVREVPVNRLPEIRLRFDSVCAAGFGNRFGAQRFGRDGGNAEEGRRLLLGETRIKDRRLARFLVSALQSELFNEVLSRRRRERGQIDLMAGDVIHHHGGAAQRWIDEPTDQDRERFLQGLISPTGPMFGAKMKWPFPPADRWERRVLSDSGLNEDLFRGRKGLKIWGDRRPLRALVEDAALHVEGAEIEDADPDDSVTGGSGRYSDVLVEFSLGPGCYASVCLEEIFGPELKEASHRNTREAAGTAMK